MEYNWVFHIFKVWGKGTVVTHRWAAFFFSETQNMKGFCKI